MSDLSRAMVYFYFKERFSAHFWGKNWWKCLKGWLFLVFQENKPRIFSILFSKYRWKDPVFFRSIFSQIQFALGGVQSLRNMHIMVYVNSGPPFSKGRGLGWNHDRRREMFFRSLSGGNLWCSGASEVASGPWTEKYSGERQKCRGIGQSCEG